MASLTIRKLDDATKAALRVRAAKSGRSVEDEVRVILRHAAENGASDVAASVAAISQAPFDIASQQRARSYRVTLIIAGGIAAYKSLDLIRRLKERGCEVRCVLTRAAQQFITSLAASALAHTPVYSDLFDAKSEFDAGHIRLARDCDLIVIAPATADLIAKMANGHGDDLATAILLATDKPVLVAPAMNPLMWNNPATRRNVARLKQDGAVMIGPNSGEMAERGEAGTGRIAEPLEIAEAALTLLRPAAPGPLAGKHVLITAGPTHEAIDPVRYIANRSSGKQGYAIAAAAQAAGAQVTLISGPVELSAPAGVTLKRVESAQQMLEAVEVALPADVAIFAAAVADWRVASEGGQKIKKDGNAIPPLALIENPDILATIAHRAEGRPRLVIGFAAETEKLLEHASAKLVRKGCDWIVANDVSPQTGVMGGDRNTVHVLSRDGSETNVDEIKTDSWPVMTKQEVATALVARIAEALP